MDAYEILLKGIKDRVSESNQSKGRQSFAVSKSDMATLMTGFLNTPEHTVTEYTYSAKDTSGTGEPLKIEKRPAMRYRLSLIPVLRELGLDVNDAEKIKEGNIKFSKEHAEAMMEVAQAVQMDYLKAGRKLKFPITDAESTGMELTIQPALERVVVGNRFAKDQATDPTITVTKPRNVMKAKNPVPWWLKSTKTEAE